MHLPWLSQTIVYLHAPSVRLCDAFAIEQLPRSLRYCYLGLENEAKTSASTPSAVLNFVNLPRALEELWLGASTSVFETVYIPSLPQHLCICILHLKSFRYAWIRNSGIPQALAHAVLNSDTCTKVRVHCIDEGNLDDRVLVYASAYHKYWPSASLGVGAKNIFDAIRSECFAASL